MLKKAKDKDLLLRPLVSSIAPRLKKEYQKAIEQQEGGFVDDKTGGKRKRDDVPLKPGRKKINAPTMDQIKLPEKYKLVPVPKGDVVNTQDPSIVQLSKTARAKEIQLKDVGEGDLKGAPAALFFWSAGRRREPTPLPRRVRPPFLRPTLDCGVRARSAHDRRRLQGLSHGARDTRRRLGLLVLRGQER